jgi:hypothetical protein
MKISSNITKGRERSLHILEPENQAPNHSPKERIFATIGSEIKCDKAIFDTYSYEGWSNIHHDLLIVCAAVEYADRRWARSADRWSRSILITLPVLELAIWLDSNVQQNLRDTLRHLTGDNWQFKFVQNHSGAIVNPRQRPLFPNQQKKMAIAYSEGLDSLCISGLYNENDEAVCVRVAKNKQRRRSGERPFDRLPFDVTVKSSAEDSARSRGFKFACVTAIAAQLAKVDRIIVPESGQGALGAVLLPLRNIYPDYRNHPTFFRRMEKFIQAALGIGIIYEQPRLWYTKGQTVAAFLAMPGTNAEQVIDTRSCWQQRANVRVGGKLRQCGICAACQLRRMSLHAARVEEPAYTYTVADLSAERFADALPKQNSFKPTATLYDYGFMGTRHLQQLADFSMEPDVTFKPYVFELAEALGSSMQDVQGHLREMLRTHSDEWGKFAAAQGEQSFLKLWAMGGRHG